MKEITLQNVELSDIHNRPELITSLIYKKLLQTIDEAIICIADKRFDKVNYCLQLCSDLLTRLGFGIKYEAGILADRLEMLYQYLFDLIITANMKKDAALLSQAKKIIGDLDEAWDIAMKNEKAASFTGNSQVSNTALPLNPYQQREILQEMYDLKKEKNK
ncbi:flagellar protein FliS [Aneurinibacillus sp. Ricciae_BoGa-3]|uniref:flagellar export chaperone FliS n=1 Tax=Aneurinibacillus sp. Ricciae_BoGa-3 TaxID=3022697 RepID=UPI002341C297|nr:flagellar protein FliS [Aneurinibacillus sp. Ricciae_BoGa-3]WCK54181.1 flagellar protein FliS [Aneurinibacillus sp. Ricciae_BoGa-3]